MENKELFARRLSEALVECGGGRYRDLAERPLSYGRRGGLESVSARGMRVDVTCDSLPAMMRDAASLFL